MAKANGRVKAKETEHNNYHFRSRLEARWAVFLEELGVKYEYEPETFNLPNGRSYLPDFRVKCYGKHGRCDPNNWFWLYIEVKGEMTLDDLSKIKEFAKEGNSILVVGDIPNPDCWGNELNAQFDQEPQIYFNYETIDEKNTVAMPAADEYGHFYLLGKQSSYYSDNAKRAEAAYRTARKAAFEYERKVDPKKLGVETRLRNENKELRDTLENLLGWVTELKRDVNAIEKHLQSLGITKKED